MKQFSPRALSVSRRFLKATRDRLHPTSHWLRELLFPLRVRHLSGPQAIEAGPDDVIVVCLVRDGEAYLDDFYAHYRAIGVKHIVFLDNGSRDAMTTRAAALVGVTVLRTTVSYRHFKVIMKQYLVRRFGHANWVLCVDIDEFFDFPYREHAGLTRMVKYLRKHGYTAVVAQMLDLFPSGPLLQERITKRIAEVHCYYDLSALHRSALPNSKGHKSGNSHFVYQGGVRRIAFRANPCLTKHPLLRQDGGIRLLNSHSVEGAYVADFSCVLLHYKYVGNFVDYMARVEAEESFYQASAEYKRYLRALRADPDLSLYSTNSRRLESVDQLVDEGFIHASSAYREWMDEDAQEVPLKIVAGEEADSQFF